MFEMTVACALFSVMLIVTGFVLRDSSDAWRRVWGSQKPALALSRVERSLRRDLLGVSPSLLRTTNVYQGDLVVGTALQLLSARADGSGPEARKADGRAFFQRNIVYYAARVPEGCACALDPGSRPERPDARCPHKLLLRLVLDTGYVTTPDSAPQSEEDLLGRDDLVGWLVPPTRFSADSVPVPGPPVPGRRSSIEAVALGLSYFHASLDSRKTLTVDARALNETEAEHRFAVGQTDLSETGSTARLLLTF